MRALGDAGARADAVPREPARGPLRLDRVPSADAGRTRGDRRRRSASIRSKPVIGLLTNVSWDAQLHYPANAFPNMLDWLVQTCEYFATRPDLQLLIRVHPAEISGFPPSRQPILARAAASGCRSLPPNIIVVPPESGLSTLRADVALQRGDHLRHEDGRRADERRAAGHRGRRSVDPEQGHHPRRQLAGRVFPASLDRLPFAERLGAGAARAGAPLRLSFLLQPDDPAAVHRAEGRVSHLPAQARSPAAAAPRRVGRDWIRSATASSARRRSSCATRTARRRARQRA